MSLTSQLRDGELGAWCKARFTGSADLAGQVGLATRDRRAVAPIGRPAGRHWAAIGGAFGARIAALVQPAPPYYALFGLVNAGLVRRSWADDQAARYPTHSALPPHDRMLDLRPTVAGWFDLDPTGEFDSGEPDSRSGFPAEPVLADLLDRTRAYFAQHAPPGRVGTKGAEIGLARSCWLLEIFESVYRSGQVHEIHQLFRPGVPSLAELRGTASEVVVTELAALAEQLTTLDAVGTLRRLAGGPPAGQPLGIAAPAFVNHWADGDVVLTGPSGSTLLEVKTVLKTGDRPRATQWLWQLVAYAWLDVADRYQIRDVGFYFARHGALVTWPLDDLVDRLLDGHGQADARREFDRVAARVIEAEGARLPI
ncbi:MAG TPA: hypothetical protein VEO01_38980 [Pseudonocardiaceae bacterium]|nr:hypothetical protein [Pseudonocardiaceae bacterium]